MLDLIAKEPSLCNHHLSEKLAHYFHSLVASVHIIYGVTHSEKHGFDAPVARFIVEC